MNGIHNAEPPEYEWVLSVVIIAFVCIAAYLLYLGLAPGVIRHAKHVACMDGEAQYVQERRAASLEREADAVIAALNSPSEPGARTRTPERTANAARLATTAGRRSRPCPPEE